MGILYHFVFQYLLERGFNLTEDKKEKDMDQTLNAILIFHRVVLLGLSLAVSKARPLPPWVTEKVLAISSKRVAAPVFLYLRWT